MPDIVFRFLTPTEVKATKLHKEFIAAQAEPGLVLINQAQFDKLPVPDQKFTLWHQYLHARTAIDPRTKTIDLTKLTKIQLVEIFTQGPVRVRPPRVRQQSKADLLADLKRALETQGIGDEVLRVVKDVVNRSE